MSDIICYELVASLVLYFITDGFVYFSSVSESFCSPFYLPLFFHVSCYLIMSIYSELCKNGGEVGKKIGICIKRQKGKFHRTKE
jgi:hypothetical protein